MPADLVRELRTEQYRQIEQHARELVDSDRAENDVAVAHFLGKLHAAITLALIEAVARKL